MQYQSNAQWPLDVYNGMYGDGISTDKHDNRKMASIVCDLLDQNGFGGEGKHFPIRTWVSEVNDQS